MSGVAFFTKRELFDEERNEELTFGHSFENSYQHNQNSFIAIWQATASLSQSLVTADRCFSSPFSRTAQPRR